MKPERGDGYRQGEPAWECLAPLRKYRETVLELFPSISRRSLDGLFLSTADALFLGFFLEQYPRSVVALEIGARVGDSAFYLASHPKVSKVVSINPNPPFAERLTARSISDREPARMGSEPLSDLMMLDVARRAAAEHPEEQAKISFVEDRLDDAALEIGGELAKSIVGGSTPASADPRGGGLLALVDGLHDRESVRKSLKAVFELSPQSVVFVGDSRYARGPFVQAGIADFMAGTAEDYSFRPVRALGPGLASSDLCGLYPDAVSAETEETLKEVSRVFSLKLDPLRLLTREEELISTVNELYRRLTRAQEHETGLQEQLAELQERNAELVTRHSGRRYKMADAVAETLLRAPGAKRLLQRSDLSSSGHG